MMKETARSFVYLTTGLVLGGATGYLVTKKLLDAKFETELHIQIQDVKDHYKLVRKEGEFASPLTVKSSKEAEVDYNNVLEGLEYIDVEEGETETVVEVVEEDEDDEEEVVVRNPNEPYIISIKEFMQDRDEYDKVTVSYFEDDDVLCDEREEVIPNVEATVGSDALTKFGELSEDSKIVYVRNERIKTDFEVLRDPGSYSEIVLGFKEESGVRKMRNDD